jgi:hypothetical protein
MYKVHDHPCEFKKFNEHKVFEPQAQLHTAHTGNQAAWRNKVTYSK